MKSYLDFSNQIILDLANNHQGDLRHAKKIVDLLANECKDAPFSVAIKFQFRDLPNFVHPDARDGSPNKHVKRFLDTRLSWADYEDLLSHVRARGFGAICTPFDELSVDRIREMGFDAIKIASCSATDWPLLERVAGAAMPVIASTGGLDIGGVDDLVSFLDHRGCDFALMHCVSIYPTSARKCNILNIQGFRRRFPSIPIGWSTHEDPSDLLIGPLAMAAGASLFERHVGLPTDQYKLNAYSSTPAQIADWVRVLEMSRSILGSEVRPKPDDDEVQSVLELQRGVYAAQNRQSGDQICRDSVFFAFPRSTGQLSSGEWNEAVVLKQDVKAGERIDESYVTMKDASPVKVLKDSVHEVKGLLAYAGITLQPQFETEFSHHYGVENFRSWGATIITLINRSYAKKILVMLPRQKHPNHYHKLKEETFLVVFGKLSVNLGGHERLLCPGETLLVPPGVFHSFSSEEGCVFEEISTTAIKGDSVYQDEKINALQYGDRKTSVDNWGRFQMSRVLGGG